jgi:hypothetical protein
MGRKPGDQLMELLDGQMETISGDFKSQHVSDTLWAYARMRRKPGERLMGLLEGRMETMSGEFSSQCFRHAVGVCDDTEETGGTADGAAGGAGGSISGEFDSSIDMSCHCIDPPAPVT